MSASFDRDRRSMMGGAWTVGAICATLAVSSVTQAQENLSARMQGRGTGLSADIAARDRAYTDITVNRTPDNLQGVYWMMYNANMARLYSVQGRLGGGYSMYGRAPAFSDYVLQQRLSAQQAALFEAQKVREAAHLQNLRQRQQFRDGQRQTLPNPDTSMGTHGSPADLPGIDMLQQSYWNAYGQSGSIPNPNPYVMAPNGGYGDPNQTPQPPRPRRRSNRR